MTAAGAADGTAAVTGDALISEASAAGCKLQAVVLVCNCDVACFDLLYACACMRGRRRSHAEACACA
eukprot:2933501-Pleurochrysis_carterae.AAC.8